MNRKPQLIQLGVDALAEALLELAVHSEDVDDLIERLISTPAENTARFKKKLSQLKRSRRFVHWRASEGFARELAMLLEDVKAGVDEPLTGLELVAAFYESDETIFEMCDDSSGNIGHIFRHEARALFAEYASRCSEKEKIAEIILEVNRKDDYGIRDSLFECAGECLPEPVIRNMIASLQARADQEPDDFGKRHHLMLVESLAWQIKDPELFARTRIGPTGKVNNAALVDIARVFLESGDVETAHSWLKKFPDGENFLEYERDNLLLKIYRKQGDSEKLAELLYKRFRSHRSNDRLEDLLDVVGNEKREEIVESEVRHILKNKQLREADARFLLERGMIDEAEEYLINRADQVSDHHHGSLLPLAVMMDSEKRFLPASLLYRCLLVSILERGNTKAYHHGARYLKRLDRGASAISDWKAFDSHEVFKEQIIRIHGRKRSFWTKYGDLNEER